ncbi:ATP-binding protein [Larkinella insperata]|uniref:ATP-binding protein n=1 Tax=Larkinella insperata TaxID=332158 RepID=A0ABW3Q833_9BACT|nr:ATP-binding protein [Larkinella insperata]
MDSYELTSLWKKTLSNQGNEDPYSSHRDLLRNTYISFRKKAKVLASEISRSLPFFTVHDITHIDALWDTADLLVNKNYFLTPTEAFILGSAFLIHDLGMGLAAYQDGSAQLRNHQIWKDTIAAGLKKNGFPIDTPIEKIEVEILKEADEAVLRDLHAKHALELALKPFYYEGNQYYLIDDPEIREAFGYYIGQVAYSHWWDIDKVETELRQEIGVSGLFPQNWSIDLLKLACLIRAADAAQIDDRRAPLFLKIIRKPLGYSKTHWDFQSKLNQPTKINSRLRYTSKSPFKKKEAESFWTCYEILQVIDKELNDVDSILASIRPDLRLDVFGVEGIGALHHLTRTVKTEGWTPIDTSLTVSNVAELVANLGGHQLYSGNKYVAIRELIQNSIDAVHARRFLDNHSQDWGDITISFGEDQYGCFIEVEDNGIGMSTNVLTKPFLDFGKTFWNSSSMHGELPGLQASNFKPIGKYGIGFYSTFMLGSKVKVITRRYDKGRNETIVLEFTDGVKARPLLRPAQVDEQLKDGGTKIRVWLVDFTSFQTDSDRFLKPRNYANLDTLESELKILCPALSVNLHLNVSDIKRTIIKANDWETIDPLSFFFRLNKKEDYDLKDANTKEEINLYLNNIRLIKNENGETIGRAFLCKNDFFVFDSDLTHGIIAVGGIRSNRMNGIGGILLGESINAARDLAIPIANGLPLQKWATEQAELLSKLKHHFDEYDLLNFSNIITKLGGDVKDLPICFLNERAISSQELLAYLINEDSDNVTILENKIDQSIIPESLKLFRIHNNLTTSIVKAKTGLESISWPANNTIDWYLSQLEGLFAQILLVAWNISEFDEVVVKAGLLHKNNKLTITLTDNNGEPLEVQAYSILKPSVST